MYGFAAKFDGLIMAAAHYDDGVLYSVQCKCVIIISVCSASV